MGRKRWTTRLTVESCLALEVGDLVRAGAFEVEPGTRCSTTWNDNAGVPISSITFRVLPDYSGALAIHFDHQMPATSCMPARIQRQIVQIAVTRCNFGGMRHWFRCALPKNGYPCKRRVRVLYSTPREKLFGCRQCHNLTYRSAQQHDQRIDRLLKLPAAEFNQFLENGTYRQKLLAVRASTVLLLRMQRKALRFRARSRNSTAATILASARTVAISGQQEANWGVNARPAAENGVVGVQERNTCS
jgi:hypothetical protein